MIKKVQSSYQTILIYLIFDRRCDVICKIFCAFFESYIRFSILDHFLFFCFHFTLKITFEVLLIYYFLFAI